MLRCGVLATARTSARIWLREIRMLSMKSFRQYAIDWGIPRVGRLFNEQGAPLSIALNALFPEQHPDVWKQFRSLVPKAPIIAHGINNSTELLPLGGGLDAQKAYIRRTLDLIEKDTGVRSRGWCSPSVYPNADTFTRHGRRRHHLFARRHGFRCPVSPRHQVGTAGPDSLSGTSQSIWGNILERSKEPSDMERLWIDYVTELAKRGRGRSRPRGHCRRDRHPSLCGWDARRRCGIAPCSENFKNQKLVWVTDVQAIMAVAGEKQ